MGKTFVTAGLARALRRKVSAVRVLKPVISDFSPETADESDSAVLLRALGREPTLENIEDISPWRFAAPLSPDMAAAREGRVIDFDGLVDFCRAANTANPDYTLIEGVGGVMVPLTETHTVLDWIAALDIAALVVVGSYLGTLSHTLTALAAMRGRGVAVAGIVVSESEDQPVPLAETAETLARFAPDIPIQTVPRSTLDDPAFERLVDLVVRVSGPLSG